MFSILKFNKTLTVSNILITNIHMKYRMSYLYSYDKLIQLRYKLL